MSRYSWENSNCKGIFLHTYILIEEYQNAVKEVCTRCGKQMMFKVTPDGRIDNLHYIAHHIRQTLPKNHPRFQLEYERYTQ